MIQSLISLVAVLVPLTVSGYMALALIEGAHPVLHKTERWTLGFLLGTTGGMFVLFLILLTGVSLSRITVCSTEIVLLAIAIFLWKLRKNHAHIDASEHHKNGLLQGWIKIAAWVLGTATALKIAFTASVFLLLTPPYMDDTINNWNMRGKVFFLDHHFTLTLPGGSAVNQQISSYPPTVSLLKASLATMAGEWNEPLVNCIHVLWYVAVLVLLFSALRRFVPLSWALLGTYVFTSLPLPLIHGTNAYADMFIAAHSTAAVLLLVCGMREQGERRQTFLRLAIVMGALLPFTKNEGLLIHFLTFAVVWSWAVLHTQRDMQNVRRTIVIGVIACVAVIVPWLAFKWTHALTFGNAKGITGLGLTVEPMVLYAFFIHTFFEGNWILLFPLCIAALGLRWRTAFAWPLVPLTVFVVVTILGQLAIYTFTALSVEALRQTGLGRGVLQVVPLCVFLTTLLLYKIVKPESDTQY